MTTCCAASLYTVSHLPLVLTVISKSRLIFGRNVTLSLDGTETAAYGNVGVDCKDVAVAQ